MTQNSLSSTRSTTWLRGCVAAVAVLAVATTGCGSDEDSASAEEQFCAAGEALQTDVTGLASVDIVSGGVDAVTEQFDAIKQDVSDMRDAGTDVAETELNALDESLDALGESLDALGGDISVANASGVATAVTGVGSAANAVFDVLSNTCS